MSENTISASAIGLPTRRLFLASGPAAAVFMSLRGAAADELSVVSKNETNPDAALIAKGNAVHDAFYEWTGMPIDEIETEQEAALCNAMHEGAEDLCHEKASTLAGVKAKARALKVHLDANQNCTEILQDADLHERLAWSLIQDLLAL